MEETLAALQSIRLATPEYEVPVFTDEPKYPSYFYPKPRDGRYLRGEPYGLSLALDAPSARAKALAEFYERLCLYNAHFGDELSRWDPQAGSADPASFIKLVARSDADRVRALRESEYRWIAAVEARTGRSTAVPAQVVIPDLEAEGETRILDAVGSSGAALGERGTEGAFERGLFEVVERCTVSSRDFHERLELRIVNMPPQVRELEEQLRRYRLEPYVFALPNPFSTPCVSVVLTDHSGVAPALSFSSRAAPTLEEAAHSGLLEALERRRPARVEQQTIRSGDRRVYPWEPVESLLKIEPSLKGAKTENFASLKREPVTFDELQAVVTRKAGEILVVDLTLPEVEAAGFEAVKVLAPGLGPMPA